MVKMRRIVMYAIAVAVVLLCNQPEIADSWTRLLIALAGFALLFLIGVVEVRRQKRENDAKPIVSVRAEVTGRRSVMVKRGRSHVRVYYLTFTTEDGSMLEFEVSELEYGRMDNGEHGTLEYRGWEYLGLRRYDLGTMEPVVEKEAGRTDAPSATEKGFLTHELEE